MIKYFTLLFFLSISFAHAGKVDKYFMEIPKHIAIEEAYEVVADIAEHYKWTVLRSKSDNNSLRIKLDHRGYRAALIFYFSDLKITYSDSTKIITEIDDEFDSRYGSEVWVDHKVPPGWLKNLKRGIKKRMGRLRRDNRQHIVIDEIKNSSVSGVKLKTPNKTSLTIDDVQTKLEGLKNLRDKGLITQEEYDQKKKDILSRL